MVRAKFFVSTLQPSQGGSKGGQVKLSPVYSADPEHENKAFWDATPSGEVTMYINNPVAFKFFMDHGLGSEFYVDFTPAPKAA
jgi:hypothetical protein